MFKSIIAIITIIGIAPAVLFSLTTMSAHLKVMFSQREPGTFSFVGGQSLEVGGNSIVLNPSIWPAVFMLGGAILLLIGLFWYFTPNHS
jgi:hypothetical protein